MSLTNKIKVYARRYVDAMPRCFLFSNVYSQHIDLCRQVEEDLIDIEHHQRTALSGVLKHALSTVPFYRRNYQINTDSISEDNAYEVLQRFDYLDKATVMACPKEFVSDKYRVESLLTKTSSSSTGQGIRVFYDRRELGIERAYVEYPWYQLGFNPWSLLVQAHHYTRRPYKDSPFGYGFRRVYLSCDHTTSEWMPHVICALRRIKPSFLHGFPSVWAKVAQNFRAAGLRLPVRGVLLCSEEVFPEQIELLQEIFGPVSVGYGQSERAVIAYGSLKNGNIRYRLMPTYSYTENLMSQYRLPEVIGTNLFVKTMPLIRYRTQDLGRINGDGELVSLDGRIQEVLVTKGGQHVPGTNVTIDPFLWDYVESYQVVQNKPGELELHIVRKHNYNEDIEKLLLKKQVSLKGELFDIKVVHVEKTPAGKQRWVVSNLGQHM